MAPVSQLSVGSTFAERYYLEGLLGRGGMGDVFLAFDNLLGHEVALKILHAELTTEPTHVARFLREIQLSRKLVHPHIIRTLECGQLDNRLFFTMEHIEGYSLREVLKTTKRHIPFCIYAIECLAQGLSIIHQAGVIHRDLKPENILVSRLGVIKIGDFGVARTQSATVTQATDLVGSMAYVAPELWRGNSLSPAADMYSLGILMYELLTGTCPFVADSASHMMFHHLEVSPPKIPLERARVPAWLQDILFRLLEKYPHTRLSSCEKLLALLQAGAATDKVNYSLQGCAHIKMHLEKINHDPEGCSLKSSHGDDVAELQKPQEHPTPSRRASYGKTAVHTPSAPRPRRRIYRLQFIAVVVIVAFALIWIATLAAIPKTLVAFETSSFTKSNAQSVESWPQNPLGPQLIQKNPDARPTLSRDPLSGRQILSFDGVDDFLSGNPVLIERLNHAPRLTFCFIAKTNRSARPQYFFTIQGDDLDKDIIRFGYTPDAKLELLIQRSRGNEKNLTTSNSLVLNELSVYSLILDRDRVNVFQNGRLVLSQEGSIETLRSHARTFSIGQEWDLNGASGFFGGTIGDFLIFDHALSDEERHSVEKHFVSTFNLPPLD